MGNSGIFSGLDKLGLKNVDNLDLYSEEKKEKNKQHKAPTLAQQVLYDKSYVCPVCSNKISSRAVKSGKAKLVSTDTDLRPVYETVDPTLYDVVLCNKCGYASLSRFFKKLTAKQKEWILSNISKVYKSREYPNQFTYPIAIERYKLALLNAVVKKAKASEKAYICLKICWLLRSYKEEIQEQEQYDEKMIEELIQQEKTFVEKAYQGLTSAYGNERFPLCGLDEVTVQYLIGELARKQGMYDESLQWLSKVILAKSTSERLKDKAREIKELIKKEKASN